MLENFQPFMDYKKLIELQSQGVSYYLVNNSKKIGKNNQPVLTKKKQLKIGKK